MDNDKPFHSAGDILNLLFDKIIPDDVENYGHFFTGWKTIVGQEMAFHVKPLDIHNDRLILETDHPAWSQQVLFRKEAILREISKKYPNLGIRDLRVKVGRSKVGENTHQDKDSRRHSVDKGNPTTENSQKRRNSYEDKDFGDILKRLKSLGDGSSH